MAETAASLSAPARVEPGLSLPSRVVPMLGVPAGITAILYFTRLNDVSTTELLLAFALCFIPWWSFQRWRQRHDNSLPLFTIIAAVYWLFFAVPLFWGDRIRPVIGPTSYLPDSAIQQAMLMAVVGVLCLGVGAALGIGRRARLPISVDLKEGDRTATYLRLALILGAAIDLGSNTLANLDPQTRQIVLLLQSSIPLLAYILLLRRFLTQPAARTQLDTAILLAYIGETAITGIASGWLGALLNLGIASVAVYVWDRRRLPMVPIVLALAYVFFFQAGKEAFRTDYWYNPSSSGSAIDRAQAWGQLAFTAWQNAFIGSGGQSPLDLARLTIQRSSLLQQTAHVVETTPVIIPYQGGSTYSYLITGWVPRIIWPDKPSVNDANRYYQLVYGVTNAAGLDHVSISVGSVAEAYINFGWPGIIIVMVLLGILFDAVQANFLSGTTGRFLSAMGILILLHFVVIESQMAVYLSGILQTLVLAIIVLLPILRFQRHGTSATE